MDLNNPIGESLISKHKAEADHHAERQRHKEERQQALETLNDRLSLPYEQALSLLSLRKKLSYETQHTPGWTIEASLPLRPSVVNGVEYNPSLSLKGDIIDVKERLIEVGIQIDESSDIQYLGHIILPTASILADLQTESLERLEDASPADFGIVRQINPGCAPPQFTETSSQKAEFIVAAIDEAYQLARESRI